MCFRSRRFHPQLRAEIYVEIYVEICVDMKIIRRFRSKQPKNKNIVYHTRTYHIVRIICMYVPFIVLSAVVVLRLRSEATPVIL